MRVLVLWADDRSTNLGVQALATGAGELVRSVWPEACVEFQSYGPGVAPSPPRASKLLAALAGADRSYARWLRGYDLVVDTGAGDSFADIYGPRRLLEMSALRRLAVRAGAAVILAPQTIGPFEARWSRVLARRSLKGVQRVYARDEISHDFTLRQLGIDAPVMTDVVFAIPRPEATVSRDVVFNVSGLLWQPNPHVDHERYRAEATAYCARALEQGYRVSLLAHVLDSDHADNDRPAVDALARRLATPVETLIPESLQDVRAMIGTARLVVGARMHACLNALSMGVPALPWAYSRKFAPLLDGLGWSLSLDLRSEADVAERSMEVTEQILEVPPVEGLARVRTIADERLGRLRDDLRETVG
jgi:colanic acid/amylovoran biosynthesis protein